MLFKIFISRAYFINVDHLNPNIDKWLHLSYQVCDGITYLFLNFNGAAVEVLGIISNFMAHFTKYMVTYAGNRLNQTSRHG